jgi:hypothetical protein
MAHHFLGSTGGSLCSMTCTEYALSKLHSCLDRKSSLSIIYWDWENTT